MKYRREIDGLRAIAVMPVILFHAGFEVFRGGFVGVDVFFVISGYLITTILLSDLEDQKFSLVRFYERRARRILPALFVVLLFCVVMAWFWLVPNEFRSFSKSVNFVSTFRSNIFFYKDSGYFSTASDLKPLLHTWSLAVEEQYYVFFPLLLLLLWKINQRLVLPALVLLGVCSLAYAQITSQVNANAAFYLLPSRIWELIVGALVAYWSLVWPEHFKRLVQKKVFAEIGSLLGLCLLVVSIFFFDKSTPFPGFYALVPTLGAAAIIVFASPYTLVGRLLSTRVLVGLGLISYSAYLWHQPLFAFARHASLGALPVSWFLILVILSLLLAFISWRFIERPFRDKNWVGRRLVFALSLVGIMVFVAGGLYGHDSNGFPGRYKLSPEIIASLKSPADVRRTVASSGKGKKDTYYIKVGGSEVLNAPQVAFFGDSHLGVLAPVLDEIGKEQGFSVVRMGAGGCPPLLGVDVGKGNFSPGFCEDLAAKQYDYVEKNQIKNVVLVARWSLYTDGDYDKPKRAFFLIDSENKKFSVMSSREVFERSLRNTIIKYEEIGVNVVVLLQVPQQDKTPTDIYYSLSKSYIDNETLKKISVNFNKHIMIQEYNRNIFDKYSNNPHVRLLSIDDTFCDNENCTVGVDKHSYYFDYNHLSIYGAELVKPDLSRFFKNYL